MSSSLSRLSRSRQARTGSHGRPDAARATWSSSTSTTNRATAMRAKACSASRVPVLSIITSGERPLRRFSVRALSPSRAFPSRAFRRPPDHEKCADVCALPPCSGSLGYTWKSYGPYCAPEGWHNLTYTSDANPQETSFTITDSYGLIKASGSMDDFPVSFHTISPAKFCNPDGGLAFSEQQKRARKLLAFRDQYTPRVELEQKGFLVPQDAHPAGHPPLSVWAPTDH